MQRVERHIIKSNNDFFGFLLDYCHLAKNLYNHALFVLRQTLDKGEYLCYQQLDKILKNDVEYPDYRALPAQCSQQILRLLDKNWKSFWQANKAFKKNPSKFNGQPKVPDYKPKTGYSILILTNQQCKIKNGMINFPKCFCGFQLHTKVDNLQQIRITPRKTHLVVEVVYNKKIPAKRLDNSKYLGIDIGVDNLAAIATNCGNFPVLLNGKSLKSINQFYNKRLANLKSICETQNDRHTTKRIANLTLKRDCKINDYLHKASRWIVDFALENNINTIIIGKNDGWKQKSNIGKRNNQNFVQIPFAKFISMLEYKCEDVGLNCVLTEESYTSGTSVLDEEQPVKAQYNKSRRKKRGLFKSNTGKLINADVNAAFQMIKKVVPDVVFDGIEDVVTRPSRIKPIRVNV